MSTEPDILNRECQSKILPEIERNRNEGKLLAKHYNMNEVFTTVSRTVQSAPTAFIRSRNHEVKVSDVNG